MYGPQIIARTLTKTRIVGKTHKHTWQYHSRSDRHSTVACWAILFDLLCECRLLREHVAEGAVAFGINHEMRDFKQNRKKNLDLVLCTPGEGDPGRKTFRGLVDDYQIYLDDRETAILRELPEILQMPVGTVQLALEAKACMTEHMKARPRLFDELNSSHQCIHGASDLTIAAGVVMVNVAESFVSPGRNKFDPGSQDLDVSKHRQPHVTEKVIEKVTQLPRRAGVGEEGYDALSIMVVECRNDLSPVTVVAEPPAPGAGDLFSYPAMIKRLAHLYQARFPHE